METSVIALAVATAVVLVLLMTCWKSEEPRARRRVRDYVLPDIPNADHQLSDVGSGVSNRQLRHQYGQLIDGNVPLGDYSQAIKHMALEPEVFSSHDDYAWDVGVANKGASRMVIVDHPNDINGWVGLRPPSYDVFVGEDSRTQPSEYHDQMRMYSRTGHV